MTLELSTLAKAEPSNICQSCGAVSLTYFCNDCDLGGPGGIDLYAAAFEGEEDECSDCEPDTAPALEVNWNSGPVATLPRSGLPNPLFRVQIAAQADDIVDPLPQDCPGGDNGTTPGDERDRAKKLAQALANTIKAPTYVVQQADRYLIQDDDDLSVYHASTDPATIVATFQPQPTQTLDTLIATQARGLCLNCGGEHRTWQCGEIRAALFAPAPAPWSDPDLGRELWRMRWRRYAAFLTLIRSVPTEHLVIYAASYQAFVRSINAQSDLQINDILKVWGQMLGGHAPAMRAA